MKEENTLTPAEINSMIDGAMSLMIELDPETKNITEYLKQVAIETWPDICDKKNFKKIVLEAKKRMENHQDQFLSKLKPGFFDEFSAYLYEKFNREKGSS